MVETDYNNFAIGASHFDIQKTINLLNQDFWWSSLSTKAKDYAR